MANFGVSKATNLYVLYFPMPIVLLDSREQSVDVRSLHTTPFGAFPFISDKIISLFSILKFTVNITS